MTVYIVYLPRVVDPSAAAATDDTLGKTPPPAPAVTYIGTHH